VVEYLSGDGGYYRSRGSYQLSSSTSLVYLHMSVRGGLDCCYFHCVREAVCKGSVRLNSKLQHDEDKARNYRYFNDESFD
jgi:hypothetical protein